METVQDIREIVRLEMEEMKDVRFEIEVAKERRDLINKEINSLEKKARKMMDDHCEKNVDRIERERILNQA